MAYCSRVCGFSLNAVLSRAGEALLATGLKESVEKRMAGLLAKHRASRRRAFPLCSKKEYREPPPPVFLMALIVARFASLAR